jgi:Ca2+-binding RTX toxin-like protein
VRERIRATAVGCALAATVLAAGVATAAETGTQAPEEEVPRCHGRQPTIVGTDGPDKLTGTPGRDVIYGGAGDDVILGSLGNDLLCGGPGADLIHGGRGNDLADGGAGDHDRVIGDLGDDTLLGGPGNYDEVAGGLGIDTLNGGPGNYDLVHGDYGYDRMDGGSGIGDIASFATDVAAGRGGGDYVSLPEHLARGDGHDKLFRFESIEGSAFKDTLIGNKSANVIDGGPGNDTIIGGGGADTLDGEQGSDKCKGAKGRTISCGPEKAPKATAYIELDSTPAGGGGLDIVGGAGHDDFTVAFDPLSSSFGVTTGKGVAIGPGCTRVSPVQVSCSANGPARWLMADLGPGNDDFRVEGSLAAVEDVRIGGGLGDDTIHGGPEDDLIEAGHGADRLYGGAGSDGLIGNVPGPTYLYGEGNGDLLAAGSGCAGGALVGGPGRDDASFAETQAHPGLLYISFPKHKAWIDAIKDCHPVRLDRTDEDMEGSFDNDVLIGDSRPNSMLGQPGQDVFYGNGGEDTIDARDGMRDFVIQCGRHPAAPEGHALTDSFDPAPIACASVTHGNPVKGLDQAAGGGSHSSRLGR